MPLREPAPGPLATVQDFVNTLDLEDGPEQLPDAEALRAWLADAALLERDAVVGPPEHERAVVLREALRDVLSGDDAAVEHINAAVAGATATEVSAIAAAVTAAMARLRMLNMSSPFRW